jgi:hypothetical protein
VSRATRLTGIALTAAASMMLAGCWTGSQAQTQQPNIPGNTAAANSDNGYLALRGLALVAETGTTGPALLVGRVIDIGPSNVEDPSVRPSGDRLLAIEVAGGTAGTGAPADIAPGGTLVFSEPALAGGESVRVVVPKVGVEPGRFAEVSFAFETNGIIEDVMVPVVPRSAYGGIELPEPTEG